MTEVFESNTDEKRLSLEQQHAVDLCCDLSEPIVGVTGGAGTGKTLVLGRVHAEAKRRGTKIALCAPTGRAAKRIEELTGIRARTVHRLLEFPMPDELDDGEVVKYGPRRGRGNPLEEKMVIVDEASMVSPEMYGFLMDALPKGGVIRFFGDNNQLPPVEEGKPPFITVLAERPSVTLSYNYRSDDELVDNAQRILRGLLPRATERFQVVYTDDPIKTVIRMAEKEFRQEDYQIITPTRKGNYGSIRINPSLQTKYNPRGHFLTLDRYDEKDPPLLVRPKDKFLWIKNDYKLNIFNGQTGTIDYVDPEDGELGIIADGRRVAVPARLKTYSPYLGHVIQYDPRKQIELGYAVTTHKAQGSEFHTIIYYVCRSQYKMLNRRNFYTAVTRAKHRVIVVADRAGMSMSMRRYEGL